ncbi:MAG: hypothetical protein LBJ81_00425 [Puniceicoccales bacterium]|jgi:hypothetical protein|nr:hypothetical protein [Puniceicoccales bacterium]
MINFYKNFAKKRAGSVTLVVLSLAAFCTILLALFLRNAIDNIKYRQQMQFPAALKMEAYSFLDLALAFLGEYKQNANAEKMNKDEGNVNKGQGKLIFDSSILGDNSSGTAIAQYITRKIGEKLANASLPELFPAVTIAAPPATPNALCLKHGDFTVQYTFEDLSGKVPLCKQFLDTTGSSFRSAITDAIPSSAMGFSEKSNLGKFIDKNQMLTQWSALEQVVRGESLLSSASQLNIEPLKEWFTIEPCILKAANEKKFKLNLLTAHQEVLNAISRANGSLSIPSEKTAAAYASLVSNAAIKAYGSTEVQFFTIDVRVSLDNGNAYTLRCICSTAGSDDKKDEDGKKKSMDNVKKNNINVKDDAKTSTDGGAGGQKRLPFNVVKIEEF